MGSVKQETRNQGRGQRQWDYITLSEPRVVSAQIKNRSRLDPSYYPSLSAAATHVNPEQTSGIFDISEPVICTYIDLERLIETCGLSKAERAVVDHVMYGYAFSDLEHKLGRSRQTYEKLFMRAVQKICKQNVVHWEETYKE